MEKDNVKENETEVNTDEKEENSVELSKEHEENTNNELQDLIEDHEEEVDSKENNKPSFGKEIFANLLDQFVILCRFISYIINSRRSYAYVWISVCKRNWNISGSSYVCILCYKLFLCTANGKNKLKILLQRRY